MHGQKNIKFSVDVAEVSVCLECDSASLGNWFLSFRDDVVILSSAVEMTNFGRWREHVGNKLPSDTLSHPKRTETSAAFGSA